MSNIKYYGTTISIGLEKQTLQYYITKVLNKIGENDAGITWYICSELDLRKIAAVHKPTGLIEKIEKISGHVLEPIYGCTDLSKKHIYISTTAINSAPTFGLNRMFQNLHSNLSNQEALLISVILDEFTHAVTGKGHGDKRYDDTLSNYKERYYNSKGINPIIQKAVNENKMSDFFRKQKALLTQSSPQLLSHYIK